MNAPLPFQQFQFDFARHIRAPREAPRPPGVPERRMRVYRELLYNNLVGFLDACFPISRRMLGEKRWGRLTRAFFSGWRSHTPYFREIPREFLHWLTECQPPVPLPPYQIELMHYEWAELAVDVMDVTTPSGINVEGDLLHERPVVNPALMSLAYRWPVHRIGPDYRPRKPAPAQFLVYRKRDETVSFIEINAVSARLISLLQAGTMTGHEALKEIASELAHPDVQAVIVNGAGLLSDLRNEQAILGTRQ